MSRIRKKIIIKQEEDEDEEEDSSTDDFDDMGPIITAPATTVTPPNNKSKLSRSSRTSTTLKLLPDKPPGIATPDPSPDIILVPSPRSTSASKRKSIPQEDSVKKKRRTSGIKELPLPPSPPGRTHHHHHERGPPEDQEDEGEDEEEEEDVYFEPKEEEEDTAPGPSRSSESNFHHQVRPLRLQKHQARSKSSSTTGFRSPSLSNLDHHEQQPRFLRLGAPTASFPQTQPYSPSPATPTASSLATNPNPHQSRNGEHTMAVATFLSSLPLPLSRLHPAFVQIGCTTTSNLMAIADDSIVGRKIRRNLFDLLEQEADGGLSRFERLVLEQGLAVVRGEFGPDGGGSGNSGRGQDEEES
ncbi:hypothetical protein T439DRAFT_344678 [Meredithblackwellia eburnea MCA 4105]